MYARTLLFSCFGLIGLPIIAGAATATVQFSGPASYATILSKSYNPKLTLSASGITSNRGRYLISDAPAHSVKSNYLSIGSTYSASTGYGVEAASIPTASTYGNYFSKLVQVVANSTDNSGAYRLDSHLNPNFSIDVDANDAYKLKFRNNLGKAATTYGYVTFTYIPSTHLLQAVKRYAYSIKATTVTDTKGRATTTYAGIYTEDATFKAAGYYVGLANGVYKLVSSSTSATPLYVYTSSDNYGIPTRMNPTGISYASTSTTKNPPAPYPSSINPTTVETGNTAFYNSINTTYKNQVATAGANASTKTAADTYLKAIPGALSAQSAKLRYSTDLYTAYRDATLAGKLASAAPADGVPGQNLVPFVYFTNEKDSKGVYHPFMNIVTYTNPGSPHGLLDIPGPPFLGAGSPTTPVTRYSNLGNFVARIPMKNYGQVSKVTDNAMIPTSQSWAVNLVTDSKCGVAGSPVATCPAYDNYNYASTADMGILIDGSIIFPVLNNTLVPSQWKGELSTYGCHVGQGGGGPHCHADGFKTGQTIVTLYNDTDYLNKTHPPIIGFGYDGIALFGVYRTGKDQTLLGYSTPLDAFGGHDHDGIGYHYHAHSATLPASYDINSNGTRITAANTPVDVLLKGAWAGNINAVPYFGYNTDFKTNAFLGGIK